MVASVEEQIAEVDSFLQEHQDRDQVAHNLTLTLAASRDEEQTVLAVHNRELELRIRHLGRHTHHFDLRILVDRIRHHNLSTVAPVMTEQLELIRRHSDHHREHFVAAAAGTTVVPELFEAELDCSHLGSGNLDIRHIGLVLGTLDLVEEGRHLDRNQVHSQNLRIHGYRNLDCTAVVDH